MRIPNGLACLHTPSLQLLLKRIETNPIHVYAYRTAEMNVHSLCANCLHVRYLILDNQWRITCRRRFQPQLHRHNDATLCVYIPATTHSSSLSHRYLQTLSIIQSPKPDVVTYHSTTHSPTTSDSQNACPHAFHHLTIHPSDAVFSCCADGAQRTECGYASSSERDPQ